MELIKLLSSEQCHKDGIMVEDCWDFIHAVMALSCLLSRSCKLAACYMFLCSSNGVGIIFKHEMSLLFSFNELSIELETVIMKNVSTSV